MNEGEQNYWPGKTFTEFLDEAVFIVLRLVHMSHKLRTVTLTMPTTPFEMIGAMLDLTTTVKMASNDRETSK